MRSTLCSEATTPYATGHYET